ncbi:MAG TPA: hypothetical protein VG602_08795 [Actinomycetota bacterium]|nr:hypothetical protein [Actinomycetota bacterium]
MARFVRIFAIAALVASFGLPAGAQEASCRLIRGADTPDITTDDVQVCRQDTWFHAGAVKLGNAAAQTGTFPTFNTTKPAGSAATGNGGGYFASSALHQGGSAFDPAGTATFDGKFTGDFDNLAVTMYLFNPVEDAQSLPTFAVNARLLVDGQNIFETGGAEVKRTPGGAAVRRIDFAAVDLYTALEQAGVPLGPDKEHQIRFQVMGTGLATEAALFVYDATEAPSGMIFNIEPEKLADYTVVNAPF